MSDLPPATLIDDARGLADLARKLESERDIAIDTEADSFFSYREKVCLIQVTAGDEDFIVDPLSGIDLAPIGEVLADPERRKIFHDGEYDVLIMKRDYGFSFANLYDTRVAAATLGSEAPGLASVLKEHFGVELDKSMQRSDWGKRPLTPKQIDYARLDTHFLIPLMEILDEKLVEADRRMVLDGECRRLERLVPPDNSFDPDEWVRVKGARNLSPRERAILKELFCLREDLARDADQPRFRIINNQTLVALATVKPKTESQLVAVHGFSPRQARKFGDRVLEAIARGREAKALTKLPKLPPKDGTGGLSEEEVELHERLKGWRKAQAGEMGFDASLLLNRHVLLQIARTRPSGRDQLEALDGIWEWQLERYADPLLEVVRRFEHDLRKGLELGRRRRRSR